MVAATLEAWERLCGDAYCVLSGAAAGGLAMTHRPGHDVPMIRRAVPGARCVPFHMFSV